MDILIYRYPLCKILAFCNQKERFISCKRCVARLFFLFLKNRQQIQDVQQPDRSVSADKAYLLSSYPVLIVKCLLL